MKTLSTQFDTSATSLEACPPSTLPEIAFIGRSNVGKSSLINFLTGKKDLAKVSATPGHTRLINFFTVNAEWRLVDLPGYGYAKTAKSDPLQFQDMVANYLERREGLRAVLVLIDSRHSPQQIDLEFVTWLAARERRFALVFTKADKVKPNLGRRNAEAFIGALAEAGVGAPEVLSTSTKTGAGRAEVLGWIRARCGQE